MRFRLQSGLGLDYAPSGHGDLTLVMLHAIGTRGALWTDVAAALAPDYRILVPDLPGHGGSDVSRAPMSIDDMAIAIGEFSDVLGGERLVLLGCSMGSAVAAAVAERMPQRVAGLVLANSAMSFSLERHRMFTTRAAAARKGMPAVASVSLERWFPPEKRAAQVDLVARVESWLLASDPVFHSWCWEALRDFDYAPRLKALTMPALVIVGTRDQTSDLALVKALADGLPNAEYQTIEGAGHLAPMDAPLEFANRVREFIRRRVSAPLPDPKE